MLHETVGGLEVIVLALGCGIVAGLILRTDLRLHWLLCAGLLGVFAEHAVHADLGGPRVLHHSVLASITAAALVIVIFRFLDLLLETWHHRFRGN